MRLWMVLALGFALCGGCAGVLMDETGAGAPAVPFEVELRVTKAGTPQPPSPATGEGTLKEVGEAAWPLFVAFGKAAARLPILGMFVAKKGAEVAAAGGSGASPEGSAVTPEVLKALAAAGAEFTYIRKPKP